MKVFSNPSIQYYHQQKMYLYDGKSSDGADIARFAIGGWKKMNATYTLPPEPTLPASEMVHSLTFQNIFNTISKSSGDFFVNVYV